MARLAGGLWQLSTAVLLAAVLAAAPTAARYYRTNPTASPTKAPTAAPPSCPNGGMLDCDSKGPIGYCYKQGWNGKYSFNDLGGLKNLLSQWFDKFNDDRGDLDYFSSGKSLYSMCGPGATSAQWVGYITVDSGEAGSYTFHLSKDGGAAQLSLDGAVIIDATITPTYTKTVTLSAGFHQLTLIFAGAGTSIPKVQLQWSGQHCCGGSRGACPIPTSKWCSCPPARSPPPSPPPAPPPSPPPSPPPAPPLCPMNLTNSCTTPNDGAVCSSDDGRYFSVNVEVPYYPDATHQFSAFEVCAAAGAARCQNWGIALGFVTNSERRPDLAALVADCVGGCVQDMADSVAANFAWDGYFDRQFGDTAVTGLLYCGNRGGGAINSQTCADSLAPTAMDRPGENGQKSILDPSSMATVLCAVCGANCRACDPRGNPRTCRSCTAGFVNTGGVCTPMK